MVKGKKILGTLAIDLQTGTRFGRVRNIIIDPEKRRAKAVILPGKRWFYPQVWIEANSVLALGRDVLSINSASGVKSTREIPGGRDELEKGIRKLWGLMVVTEEGKLLGYLEDILFSVPGGDIAGLELSRGLIGDILQGRGFYPSKQISAISFDSVVVEEG